MELHQTQKIVAQDNHDFRIVCCGRQWGKTTLSIQEAIACAFAKKDREITYFATTYDQARNIAWNMLKEATRSVWARTPNESRLELYIKTQDKGQSRISLRGFENIETARGQQFDLLIIDEVAYLRNWDYSWQAILEPTLAFRKGKALFISTPYGENHFKKLFELGQKENSVYKSWKFTSYENPYLPRERIEQAKATSTENYFAQEYLADFRKFTGLVYKEFERKIDVIEPFNISDSWLIYRGFDFGSTNPTACLWIAVDDDDNWFIVDEHYATNSTIDYHAGIINANSHSRVVTSSFGDPSGAQWFTEFAQRGIYITPANKEVGTNFNSWVRFKIEKIAEKLAVIPGRTVSINKNLANPKLFVFNNCVNTIREFEKYRWKEKSNMQAQDLNEPDIPEKSNDHAMDALSYFAVSYKKADKPYIEPKDSIANRDWSFGN